MKIAFQISNIIRFINHSLRRRLSRGGSYLISFTIGATFLAVAPFTRAQCPEICDSNNNTALGNGSLANDRRAARTLPSDRAPRSVIQVAAGTLPLDGERWQTT